MFFIKVDVSQDGDVEVSTWASATLYGSLIRKRKGATVSQALRNLAAAMVTAKAELTDSK